MSDARQTPRQSRLPRGTAREQTLDNIRNSLLQENEEINTVSALSVDGGAGRDRLEGGAGAVGTLAPLVGDGDRLAPL